VSEKLHKNMKSLESTPDLNEYHSHILRQLSASVTPEERSLESFFWMHRGHNALVRLLFRTTSVPDLREHLCLLAGKLLQKKGSMQQSRDVRIAPTTQRRHPRMVLRKTRF
jgi:hypothetical protein